MPNADDAELCLAEFRGAPLAVWPDTAEQALAAHLNVRADGEVVPAWRRFQPVPGVTLRDVDSGGVCLPGAGALIDGAGRLMDEIVAIGESPEPS